VALRGVVRLPIADGSEWEYAGRAGTRSRWYFGDQEAELKKHAWFYDNGEEGGHPIAKLSRGTDLLNIRCMIDL
jgi:formylglycine-generating enzyme required for sulfatase activity